MDELDFQIIRELLISTQLRARPDRAKFEDVAARLGVHVNTVSTRTRRLEQNGLLLPFTLQVGPPIGMQYASVFFRVDQSARTQQVRAKLLDLPGVSWIGEYLDGVLLLMFGPDQAAIEASIAHAAKLLPQAQPELETASWEHWPKGEKLRLGPHDPAILGRLALDPRASAQAIAKDLGVTARLVERRLEEVRAVHGIAMSIGGRATPEGMVLGHFLVDVDPGARTEAVAQLSKICENYFYRSLGPTRIFFIVYARSNAAIIEQAERVRAVPGVVMAKTRIFTRWSVSPGFPDFLTAALTKVRERQAHTGISGA